MRAKLVTACLLVGLATVVSAVPNAPEIERINGLINQLGSSSYRQRMEAFRALDAIGESALERLKLAAGSGDTETAHRAHELIRRIEHRVFSARILTPSLVEVKFQDTPVSEAIREFHGRTGLAIAASGATSGLKDRKVTFQSGRVSVWEALDGFCKAANMSEWNGVTPMPGLPSASVVSDAPGNQVLMPQGRVVFRSGTRIGGHNAGQQIYLYDATPSPPPTCVAGAVRVRALPVGTPLPNLTAESDEFIIPLQVTLEPRLNWSGQPSVKVGTATDDHDQRLNASVINLTSNSVVEDDFFVNNMVLGLPYGTTFMPQRSQYVALRLKKGDQPSRSLKDLSGTLSLPLRVSGVVVSVDSPLKAVGQTIRGSHGTMTVLAAERTEKGEVKIEVAVEMAPEVSPPQNFMPGGNRIAMMPNIQIQIQNGVAVQNLNGGAVNLANGTTEHMGLSLMDADGKRFLASQVTQQQQTMNGNGGLTMRLGIVYRPNKGTGEPARLAFSASHPASVETAFRLTDLPLP